MSSGKRQSLRTIVEEQTKEGRQTVATVPSAAQEQPQEQKQKIERIKPGYSLRKDLIKKIKQIALDEERPIYEVLEDAMQMLIDSKSK
jgi:hypothetical protein